MKVSKVSQFEGKFVDTDNPDFPTFMRFSATSWMNLMGESWEAVYDKEAELEAAYQEYQRGMG